MDNEEIYHLIDMLEIRIDSILANDAIFRLLSDSQKLEAVKYDRNIIEKLKSMLEVE